MQDSAQTPEIDVEDLVIHYGAVAAVGPVSFTVELGEQLTLLGPSGCGKTTTLRAIAGLERPTSGAIRIRGEALRLNPAFLRLRIVEKWNGRSPLVVPANANNAGTGLLLPLGSAEKSVAP